MDVRTCMEEGRKALAENRNADARAWFARASRLAPEDPEARLQWALSSLLCGDKRTFGEIMGAMDAHPPADTPPRTRRLWETALRFAGSLAMATAMAGTVPACSSSSKETATTSARPEPGTPANPPGAPAESMDVSPGQTPMDTPQGDEVYSKHRYSAGVRPPVDIAPQEGMDAGKPAEAMPAPPPGDEVYSKHRYSAGVRPPVDITPEAEGSMDATPVMDPPMRPPALKYGAYVPRNFD